MNYPAAAADEYMSLLPPDRIEPMLRLREVIIENLPDGFSESPGYGMLGYCVPHSIYPAGYHCNPKDPLPFMGIASQKNFIAFYHMGMYAIPQLREWFVTEYPKHVKSKLDMGKSCVRFKKMDQIPYELIGELVKKMSVEEWIGTYERNLKR
ncbi:MAG: DUF1801 domain-containing protein [Bacteroidia bacterium]